MKLRFLYLAMAAAALPAVCSAQESENPALPENFNHGMLMINEDWFGHSSGSMNFIDNDGAVFYNVYQQSNPEKCLGATTQFGSVFGNRVFVMSKQAYSGSDRSGGRFVAMNSTDLKYLGELTGLPGGDGRAFCAATAEKGYVGTSSGMFAIDLETYTASETQLAPASSNGRVQQTGDMVRYGSRVFAAQQGVGVLAVDYATDEVSVIDLPKVAGLTVIADGRLIASTTDANAEFVVVDPETLETTVIDVEGSHAISSPWSTWRPANICADKTLNRVYYVSGGGWTPRTIAAYDFDTDTFTADYIAIPEGQSFYGVISTDPKSGNVVILATENGYGDHYSHNWIYFADTATGAIIEDKTITLKEYYWFPAMMAYPDFEAPEMALDAIALQKDESDILDLAEATTLAVGNRHLIVYSVVPADPAICGVERTGNGRYVLTALATGETTLSVTADYQGRVSTIEVPMSVSPVSSIEGVASAVSESADVYTLSGVLVGRNVSDEQIKNLAPGLYIIGGKKRLIK